MAEIGRPRLNDAQREQRRLDKNKRQRERRAEIKRERDDVKRRLARTGVSKGEKAIGGAAAGFVPTAEDRARVQSLAGLGMRQDEIAIMVINPATNEPVDEKTLRLHFGRELTEGPIKANSKVAESLFNQATGRNNVKRNPSVGIYWTKARMGWRETQHVEVDIKSGVLVAPAGATPEQWVQAAQLANEGKTEPGKKGKAK